MNCKTQIIQWTPQESAFYLIEFHLIHYKYTETRFQI